jgi:hypothetical protein
MGESGRRLVETAGFAARKPLGNQLKGETKVEMQAYSSFWLAISSRVPHAPLPFPSGGAVTALLPLKFGRGDLTIGGAAYPRVAISRTLVHSALVEAKLNSDWISFRNSRR